MFNLLPEALKKEIYSYLASGDFVSAKQIYDKWCQAHAASTSSPA